MEKDIISWSANQYETESERTEAFNEFMKEFQDFLKEERTITLEEYKQQVASFWCKAKEILLVDCKENVRIWLPNMVQTYIPLYSKR